MENKDEENQPSKRVSVTQAQPDDQVRSDFAMATVLQQQERAFSTLETIDSENEEEYESEESDEYGNNYNNNNYEYLESLEELGFLEEQETEEDDEDMMDDEEEEEEDDIDPDDLTYEELIALGEIIGVEKRGLSRDEISSCLVPCKFKCLELKSGIDRCVICQVEYEEDEDAVALPNCEHPFHADCISKWLQIKKICPICSSEISSSSSKK